MSKQNKTIIIAITATVIGGLILDYVRGEISKNKTEPTVY